MTYPKYSDESMTFVGAFDMKDPQANMTVVVNRRQDTCDIDLALAWTYKENLVGLLFRGDNTHLLAVRLLFSSESCAELARKLTKLLEKRDSIQGTEYIGGVEMKGWQGNLTLSMDGREVTYGPGAMETEKYAETAIALKITSVDNRAEVVVKFSRDDCKRLIEILLRTL